MRLFGSERKPAPAGAAPGARDLGRLLRTTSPRASLAPTSHFSLSCGLMVNLTACKAEPNTSSTSPALANPSSSSLVLIVLSIDSINCSRGVRVLAHQPERCEVLAKSVNARCAEHTEAHQVEIVRPRPIF